MFASLGTIRLKVSIHFCQIYGYGKKIEKLFIYSCKGKNSTVLCHRYFENTLDLAVFIKRRVMINQGLAQGEGVCQIMILFTKSIMNDAFYKMILNYHDF